MKAIIMAGGKGTRLKPLTCNIPKPMVPVINKPTMEYTLELLKKYGIDEVAVTLSHLPNSIIDYFKEGSSLGLQLKYYVENSPLGTGGSVRNCVEFIQDTFIVLSGDALTDLDLKKAMEFHRKKKSKATLILKDVEIPLEYGVVITDSQGKITQFMEKPSWGEVFSNSINTGMYILEPEVMEYYRKGDVFDFSKDLFPKLLKDGVPIYGYVTESYWNDIGSHESYIDTHKDILTKKVEINFQYDQERDDVWIGKNTTIHNNCNIIAPVIIGDNCDINENCVIGPYAVIGDNSIIKPGTSIKRSILWKNCYVDRDTQIKGAVICDNNTIKKSVKIYENAVLGENCMVENHAVIKPDIKIWPFKKIEENTVITQNLVWGTKASKSLFGFKDVSGYINVEINPEFASKLAAAFASILPQDSTLVISSDDKNSSNLIKDSIQSGILSVGCGVIELKNSILPMTGYAIEEFSAAGGIHVRQDLSDEDIIHIDFLDNMGMNINRSKEREVENLFARDDFKRCNTVGIKETTTISNYMNHYISMGYKKIKNKEKIKRSDYKILFSTQSSLISNGLKQLFYQMGIESSQCHDEENFLEKMKLQNCDLGVMVPQDGERLILIDKNGQRIENERFDAMIMLILLKKGIQKIVVPHILPRVIEEMVLKNKAQVIRSKSAPNNIMSHMKSISEENESISQYLLTYNPIWSIGVIVDFLFDTNLSFEHLIDELPKFYYVKNRLVCEFKDKGRVIREMVEQYQTEDLEMYEGIKISNEKGWTIIIPDSEKPQFNIFTEGFTEEYAQELSTFYHDKLEEIMLRNVSNQ